MPDLSKQTISEEARRSAVANLTTYCERMIARGKLPALDQLNLLNFVNETCAAFEMEKIS